MSQTKDKNHPAVLSLKDYQFRKKISRDDLAEKAGIGLGTLNKLMSGEIPTDATLRTIESKLGIRLLASYQMVAHPDLGEYPKSWCDDLIGEYISIRQNRYLDKTDIINTFPVRFEWCNEKPGLKMTWELIVDGTVVKRQSAYVSMTSRDGALTILSDHNGVISTTHLQRDSGDARRLYGLHCGLGQVARTHRSIIAQVVAYLRPSEINFKHDNQVWPGGPGHRQLVEVLGSIEGIFGHMVRPPATEGGQE
ncbi:multiprotein-bridging factor 1 family protein [Rhizobium ruizarguesonis]